MKFDNDKINHLKNGDVEYLNFKKLDKYKDKFNYGFFLKHGGVSKGLTESLNFRINGLESKENVLKNLEIVSNTLKISNQNIYKASQNHTSNILVLTNENKEEYKYENFNKEEYDGYVTNIPHIATLITTADCNPIIMYDPVKNVYANIHSGWKGTVKQIYLNAAKIMNEKYGCNYLDIIVCVGPSINACCWYSEDQALKESFVKLWSFEDEYIKSHKGGYLVDFTYAIKKDLIKLGLDSENILLSNICTCCNTDSFFSYRSSTMKKESYFGTMATIATLI